VNFLAFNGEASRPSKLNPICRERYILHLSVFKMTHETVIETEDRRIDGFIERLGAVNKLPSETWLETVCQITDILDRDARSKPDP
jgi:hypothetical protein